jgi:hypothetical protein
MMRGVRASSIRMDGVVEELLRFLPVRVLHQLRIDPVDEEGRIELHVVPEVVEAELVVGAVGDVGPVGFLPLRVPHVVLDHAHGETEGPVELPHPLRVAAGEIIVHRHHVNALAGERVEIHRKGCHQGLSFAGLHLGDLSLVEHHAADELHVEVPHLEDPPARLAADREDLGQKLVEALSAAEALAELGRLPGEVLVGKRLHGGLQTVDGLDHRPHPLQIAFGSAPYDLGEYAIDQRHS